MAPTINTVNICPPGIESVIHDCVEWNPWGLHLNNGKDEMKTEKKESHKGNEKEKANKSKTKKEDEYNTGLDKQPD